MEVKIMNVAIVGCGLIGFKRAQNLRNATLVACADVNLGRAKLLSDKFGHVPYFDSMDEILDKVEIDILIICTPHNLLPGLIKKGIEKGKHILVEKPAGRFCVELEGLSELADHNHCKVRVGFNHRYHRAFRKSLELVKEGLIGKIMFIRGRYGHGGRVGYEKEWRAIPDISGGGELIDQGSHLIDLSRMFLGNFTDISGHADTYFWDMPVDDNAFLNLRTAEGQTAFLQVSCTEWKNMFSFEIYGLTGKLEIQGLGGSYGTEKLTFYKMSEEMGPPETTSWEYPMADDSWSVEFQSFLDDINQNKISTPGIIDAMENLKIINTIYKMSGYDYNA
jgi:predicted dehydrogenase